MAVLNKNDGGDLRQDVKINRYGRQKITQISLYFDSCSRKGSLAAGDQKKCWLKNKPTLG